MKIFISYRRDDSAGYAGRLFDYLTEHFGSRKVFMDIDTIEPGDDFRKVVQNAVGTCNVVVVLIGKQWVNIADPEGHRRLDDPQDWVRAEVSSALVNPDVRVIPVLVHDASMPRVQDLPEDLRELAYRNALELSDSRFQHDAKRLAEAIEQAARKVAKEPVTDKAAPGGTRYWGFATGAVVLGILVLALLTKSSWLQMLSPTPVPTSTHAITASAIHLADTKTPIPPTPTATTTPESAAPVILGITTSVEGVSPKQQILIEVQFSDPQGDAQNVVTELVAKTISSNLPNLNVPILAPAKQQIAGTTIPMHWKCAGSGAGYTVTFNFFVTDQAGNRSEPKEVLLNCKN